VKNALRMKCGSYMLLLVILITRVCAQSGYAAGASLSPAVEKWLNAQTNLQTWSADCLQTRTFKSLTQPLTASGSVWFSAPNQFRWELGNPPQTIAVRVKSGLLVIYPRLKRAESYPLEGDQAGPWRDALALLEAGFPRSQQQLNAQFNLLSEQVTTNMLQLTLEPKSAGARRMMPQIRIELDMQKSMLLSTELQFADGSTMRNDFKNQVMNPKIDPELFSPNIPIDYKVVEPLKKR
jgi:outer membrane lipoprotein-sorting protein